MGMSFLVTIVAARYLGPTGFGEVAFFLTVLALGGSFVGFGMTRPLQRRIIDYGEDFTLISYYFQMAVMLAFLFAAVLIHVFSEPSFRSSASYLALLISALIFQASGKLFSDVVEGYSRFRAVLVGQVSSVTVGSVLRLISAFQGNLLLFLVGHVVERFVLFVSSISFYLTTRSRQSVKEAAKVKSLFAEAMPIFFSSLAVVLYLRADIIMLDGFAATEEVGIYAAAARITEITFLFLTAITNFLFVRYVNNKSNKHRRRYMRRLLLVFSGFGLFFSTILLSQSELIIRMILGEEFLNAADVLRILAISILFVYHAVLSGFIISRHGFSVIDLSRTIVGLVINIALNALLIPKYGAEGAATASAVSYFCAAYVILFRRRQRRFILARI